MRVQIKILNGSNPRSFFLTLQKERVPNRSLHYILETEAIEIRLICDEPLGNPKLIVNLQVADFDYIDNEETTEYVYILSPRKTYPYGYECMFYNYFGVVELAIEYGLKERTYIESFSQFEVLARKYTANQASMMFEYILTDSGEGVSSLMGVTNHGGVQSEKGEKPERLIGFLSETLNQIEKLFDGVFRRPLTKVSVNLEVVSGSKVTELTDQSVAWLSENMCVLHSHNDPLSSHLITDDKLYQASHISTPIISESYDIYENRVLHGFVRHLLSVARSLHSGLESAPTPPKINTHQGYESFFKTMSKWVSSIAPENRVILNESIKRIGRLISLLKIYLPVRSQSSGMPIATPKVRSNTSYIQVFRIATDWYKKDSIDWSDNSLLFAIKSMPDLFEKYCLSVVGRSLSNIFLDDSYLGVSNAKDGNSIHTFYYKGLSISLYDEPDFYMPSHIKGAKYNVYNTETKNLRQAQNNHKGRTRTGKNQRRSPDIVIDISDSFKNRTFIVLDAKYTKSEYAIERDVTGCASKYILGLSKSDGTQITSALIILFPEKSDNYGEWLDGKIWPFNLDGDRVSLPIMGAQSIVASEHRFDYISKTLSKVIRTLIVQNILKLDNSKEGASLIEFN